MKIVSIIGARPQFIKCAPVSRVLRRGATELLVHTGQHYDDNMSAAFFRELEIPTPDHHLNIGSGAHGAQTGAMLAAIERILLDQHPDLVLVYGDTNSTLAGALAAAKLNIPVAHVEAGLRSFNRRMPEEINRVATDHLSTWLLCPTQASIQNLHTEAIVAGVHLVGDVMLDALRFNRELARSRSNVGERLELAPESFLLATVHRAENTNDPERLRTIARAFRTLAGDCTVVWPVHPRTRAIIASRPDLADLLASVRLVDPVPYLDMLWLTEHALAVFTDSGGLQKEACWLGTPCVTLRDETEWIETLENGRNRLAGTSTEAILQAAAEARHVARIPAALEVASASERIAEILGL